MTFNPNIFDAYDVNLIIDSLHFYLMNQSLSRDEQNEVHDRVYSIEKRLIDN